MEQEKPPPQNEATVRALKIVTRRGVSPLTDAEIVALRRMLAEFGKIKEGCPIARRTLSDR